MPCYDDRVNQEYEKFQKIKKIVNDLDTSDNDLGRTEAILCQIMGILERTGNINFVIQRFDEDSSGVSVNDLLKWWAEHKKKDLTRGKRS